MSDEELLQRIALTLKQEIGPAIVAEYPKTQAFMAAVVLEKLARQLALARAHELAERDDLDALIADLNRSLLAEPAPASVREVLAQLASARDKAALCRLIAALYAARGELGEASFSLMLNRVRQTLRANIDRQMEYAA